MSDEAGNAATQQTVTLGKDIIAPVVSVSNTGWINEDTETTYSVTGTCTDAVSGTASQTVSISGTESATPSCSSGTFTVAVDYSSAAEGANTVTINADISDVAGNAATTSTVTLSKDTVDPVITLTDNGDINGANDTSYTISGTCSDAVSGVNGNTINLKDAYVGFATCSSGSFTGSYDVSSSAEGAFNLVAEITDEAGNLGQVSLLKFKDTVNPTAPTSVTISQTAADTLRLSYTDGTDLNTVSHEAIACAQNDCSTSCSAVFPSASSPTFVSGLASGTYYGCVRAKDNYGNLSAYVPSASITIDQTPPVPGGSGLMVTSDNYYYTTTLGWAEATDNVTAQANITYRVYYSTNPNFDTVAEVEAGTPANVTTAAINTLKIDNLAPDTRYYFNVVVTDDSANKTTYIKQTVKTEALERIGIDRHTGCAINNSGKAYCWGDGAEYRLGNNSTAASHTPTPVSTTNFNGKYVQLATQDGATCGLGDNQKIYCWGNGYQGAMGDGSTSDNPVPTEIDGSGIGNPSWRYVAAGHSEVTGPDYDDHVCAITTDGDGYCWGHNADGELGVGNTTSYNTPQLVLGSKKWRYIKPSGNSTCGLTEDGEIYCWGRNHSTFTAHGYPGGTDTTQLGTKVVDPASGPVTWAKIFVASWNPCAITDTGDTYCWGGETTGINPVNQYTPLKVAGATFRRGSGNERNVCGISPTDALYCWGDNDEGSLGDGTITTRTSPMQIMSDVAQVSGGERRTCAIKNNGSAYCWGKGGTYAAFGVGYVYSGDILKPTMVLSGEKWLKNQIDDVEIIEADRKNTLSWTIPENATGVVILRHSAPVTDKPVDGTTYIANDTIGSATVVYAGTGTNFVDSGLTNGTTYYYAIHSYDTNTAYSNAVKFFGEPVHDENNLRISLMHYHGCAIDHNNALYCWGRNNGTGTYGALGDGSSASGSSPNAVDTTPYGTKEFRHVSAGDSSTCAVSTDDEMWCWGYNTRGAVGDGTNTHRTTAVKITGSWRTVSSNQSNWITDGRGARCGIKDDSKLYCWGYNSDSQLGDGTSTHRNVPTAVVGGLKFKNVHVGAIVACGTTMEGVGLCWGPKPKIKSVMAPQRQGQLLSLWIIAKCGKTFPVQVTKVPAVSPTMM